MTTPSEPSYLEIPLSRGLFAKVSPDKHHLVAHLSWYAQWAPSTQSYYAVHRGIGPHGKRKSLRMSRVILGLGDGDKRVAEHIRSGDTLNNQDDNLRIGNYEGNNRNRRRAKNNSTGFKGVSRSRNGKGFRVRIMLDGKQVELGENFKTAEEGHAAYVAKARERFGEYANDGNNWV